MTEIERLESEREQIRAQEKALTKQLKEARARDRVEKLPKPSGPCSECKALKKDNSEFKAMIGIVERAAGATYKNIGVMLGVSPTRARDIVERRKRLFFGINSREIFATLDAPPSTPRLPRVKYHVGNYRARGIEEENKGLIGWGYPVFMTTDGENKQLKARFDCAAAAENWAAELNNMQNA